MVENYYQSEEWKNALRVMKKGVSLSLYGGDLGDVITCSAQTHELLLGLQSLGCLEVAMKNALVRYETLRENINET